MNHEVKVEKLLQDIVKQSEDKYKFSHPFPRRKALAEQTSCCFASCALTKPFDSKPLTRLLEDRAMASCRNHCLLGKKSGLVLSCDRFPNRIYNTP